MSYHTWTAAELSSKALCSRSGICWRAVEAQHIVSTTKLVDNHAEQLLLEDLIEETKPPYPEEFQGYHFLLFTPFRYDAPYPHGSRFRRASQKEGVFYAAEKPETAIAEIAFLRLKFFQESAGTKIPENPEQLRLFSVQYESNLAIDLTTPPLDAFKEIWMDKSEYAPCQWLADEARKAKVELIVSASARCIFEGKNISIFSVRGFKSKTPESAMQTWQLIIKPEEVTATCEFPRNTIVFPKVLVS